jgi:hypothetical protein
MMTDDACYDHQRSIVRRRRDAGGNGPAKFEGTTVPR